MLISDSYTGRDLQNCRTLLQQFLDAGVGSVRDAASLISREISNRQTTSWPLTEQKTTRTCPHCGKTLLLAKVENLMIESCKKCRWSAIVENQ